jgi:sulfur carrier protein ThiS
MSTLSNPFLISNYESKEYFCDREDELQQLLRNVDNNANTTLISSRRLGKTGLIYRFFELLHEEKRIATVYIDVYSSRNIDDFIHLLADGILRKFTEKTPIGKQFIKILKGFRAVFTYDDISGTPQVQFNYQTVNDKEYTLQRLLQFLDTQPLRVVVAIDEFQQIAEYPEKNIEALLRTQIQQLKNVQFIFSGSKKHTLTEIFANAKRPFYASTQFLTLKSIDKEKYRHFIRLNFEKGKRTIEEEAINYILNWTNTYTFYTQFVCNRAYLHKKVTVEVVKRECAIILNEQESVFLQYRKLLTAKQWNLLVALAKEEKLNQFYSKDFMTKYKLGNSSTIKRMVDALLEKEMILEENSTTETTYRVYDIFLMRWLQRTYP